jgi:hypothetical protein
MNVLLRTELKVIILRAILTIVIISGFNWKFISAGTVIMR